MLTSVLSSSTVRAAPLSLFVDAGEDTAKLADMLQREPFDWTITRSLAADAALRLNVVEDRQSWIVSVRSENSVLVDRIVTLEEGREAALRVVVLLAVRAAELHLALQEPPPPAPPPPPVRAFSIGLGVDGTMWWRPTRAQFGFHAAARWFTKPVTLTAQVLMFGVPCCSRDVLGIESEAEVFGALAGIEWPWLTAGRWSVVATGELGVAYTRITAKASVFQGPAQDQQFQSVAALVRLGLGLGVQTGALETVLRLGALGRIPQKTIALPAGYPAESIRTGVVGPWIGLDFHLLFF